MPFPKKLSLLLVFSYILCSAQTSPAPNLDQLIDEALGRNLRLIAERYNISIAEARILQARLRPNPTLLLQWQYADVFGVGFSAASNPAGPPEVDAGLILPIIRGGKRAARIETARWSKASTEADFLNASRTLIFDVSTAWVDVLLYREQLLLAQQSQQALDQIVRINRARVNAGDLARVELIRSEVALVQYQNSVLQSEQRARLARFRLLSLVGRPATLNPPEITGTLRNETETRTVEQLEQIALTNRPELISARRDVDRAQAFLRLQQATATQDWSLYTWVNRQYSIGVRNGTSMTFQWNAPLPVSDRNQGEIARARYELSQAQARVRAIEFDIRNELTAAWAQHQNAQELVRRIEAEMLDRAKQARDITQYSYTRGEATLIEFLDAQRTYTETLLSWNEARAEKARSLYVLDALTGTGAH